MYSPYDDQNKNNLSEAASEAGQEKGQGASPQAAIPIQPRQGARGITPSLPSSPGPPSIPGGQPSSPAAFIREAGSPPSPLKRKSGAGNSA